MSEDKPDKRHMSASGSTADTERDSASRVGRKRDHTRDGAILEAAIDVLVEAGYIGMTMDMVARRARAGKATLYRRWDSKSALVRDAIAKMKDRALALDDLPDTGEIRADLLALFEPRSSAEADHRLGVMAGIASMLAHDSAFVEVGDAALIEPWAEASRAIIRRGIERGEVDADAVDIEMLSRIVPSMAICRALIQRRASDREFLVALIDGTVMPALRGPGSASS